MSGIDERPSLIMLDWDSKGMSDLRREFAFIIEKFGKVGILKRDVLEWLSRNLVVVFGYMDVGDKLFIAKQILKKAKQDGMIREEDNLIFCGGDLYEWNK